MEMLYAIGIAIVLIFAAVVAFACCVKRDADLTLITRPAQD